MFKAVVLYLSGFGRDLVRPLPGKGKLEQLDFYNIFTFFINHLDVANASAKGDIEEMFSCYNRQINILSKAKIEQVNKMIWNDRTSLKINQM